MTIPWTEGIQQFAVHPQSSCRPWCWAPCWIAGVYCISSCRPIPQSRTTTHHSIHNFRPSCTTLATPQGRWSFPRFRSPTVIQESAESSPTLQTLQTLNLLPVVQTHALIITENKSPKPGSNEARSSQSQQDDLRSACSPKLITAGLRGKLRSQAETAYLSASRAAGSRAFL